MAMTVLLAVDAQADFAALPVVIQTRVRSVMARLVDWPSVSGAKPLRGELAGYYRIRTGDWRILFRVVAPSVIIVRIRHRRDVYED
jgi:mRNA interferase RelE/StbE